MTLELTPEQIIDLDAAVAHKLDFIERVLLDPRTTASIAKTVADERLRLKSLLDLLHRP